MEDRRIMSSPNQRTIIIMRDETKYKGYFQVSNKNLNEALYNLKGNSFKLWCYLCDNKHKYPLQLYPVDFCRIANVSDTTYRTAFKDLEEKGYLVKDAEIKTKYWFNEKSKEAQQPPIDIIMTIDKEKATLDAYEKAMKQREEQKQQK